MNAEAYFSHDANARRDPKIIALIANKGIAGYGAFWIIIEMLREQEYFKLPCKKFTYAAIANELKMDLSTTQEFIKELINEFELLRTDSEYFWSESLLDRMSLMQAKSEKNRAAALKRWEKQSKKPTVAL